MQSYSHLLRTAGLVASTALAFTAAHAADAEKPATADTDPLTVATENYITVSGQNNQVNSNPSAFQAESWTSKKGFAGIEDFQFSKDPAKDVSVKADGHVLAGSADYLAHINVTKNEIGSIDVGYKSFRTFYDNAGGFFLPTEGTWLPIFPRELAVDRSKYWAGFTLNLPNVPVVTVRYTNDLRKGRKDTTIWGASDFTGLSAQSNSASQATRYIAPGYLDLNERHQALEGIIKHTIGKTTVELSAVADRVNNLDTRVGNRYPGEVKTIQTAPLTIVSPANISSLNSGATALDTLNNKVDTYTVTGKVETTFGTKLKVFAGASYSTLSSDFTEERPLSTVVPYPVAPAVPTNYVVINTSQAQGLVGKADIKTVTANIGAEYKIATNLTSELVLKGENRQAKASALYQTLASPSGVPAVSTTGVIAPLTATNIGVASNSYENALTPELSLRYTGIKNISLYGTTEYRKVKGDESVTRAYNTDTAVPYPTYITYSDVTENHGRYTVGANWVPCNFFTLRGETFFKDHKNDFQYNNTSTSLFVLGYKMKGARLTATVKPLPSVSMTTRYVYQTGTMDTQSAVSANYQSMDSKSHNIGETIDWTPIKQFYLQLNLNVVFDTTSTAFPRAGAANAASSGNDALRNADNNYLNGSLIAGFVVDKMTNAEIQCTQYRATNFLAPFSESGLPYGASEKNSTITVGIKRKLLDNLVANVKVGYMTSENATTGGRANYDAKIVYASLQQAF